MQLKKPTKSNLLATGAFVLLFSLGAGGATGLSYYKSTVNERVNFKLVFPEAAIKPISVDMSEHGLPKQVLQPNSVRIRARSIENKGEEALPLMIAFNGIPGTLAVKSGGEEFDTETQFHVVEAGGRWRFDIYVHLPPELKDQAIPVNGEMIVMHATDRTTLATVPISISWGDA